MVSGTGVVVGACSKVRQSSFFPHFAFIFFNLMLISDNTLYFWKYPEDERKVKPIEGESIQLHDCFTSEVTLAPRDICARMNTFMLESRRASLNGDRDALNMHVVRDIK